MSLKLILVALGVIAGVSLFAAPSAFAESKTAVTVVAGDTLTSIADAQGTDFVRLFNANDFITNPDVIDVNQVIRIPAADEQLPDRFGTFEASSAPVAATATAAYAAPSVSRQTTASTVTFAANEGNRYTWGTCTWYVYNRKPNIGSFWGNGGYGWIAAAQASGFATGSSPAAGAIAVQSGHVAYVESVSGGNVNISEMNYAGGVGVVHYRTVPAGMFSYIYA